MTMMVRRAEGGDSRPRRSGLGSSVIIGIGHRLSRKKSEWYGSCSGGLRMTEQPFDGSSRVSHIVAAWLVHGVLGVLVLTAMSCGGSERRFSDATGHPRPSANAEIPAGDPRVGISRQEYVVLNLRLADAQRGSPDGASIKDAASEWIELALEVSRLSPLTAEADLRALSACSRVASDAARFWSLCQSLPSRALVRLESWHESQGSSWAAGVEKCATSIVQMKIALANAAARANRAEKHGQEARLTEAAFHLGTTIDWSFVEGIQSEVAESLWPSDWEKMREAVITTCSLRSKS